MLLIKEFVITNKGTKEFLSLNTGFCLMENKLDFYFFSLLLLTRVNRYLLGVSSFFYFPFFVTDKVPVPVQVPTSPFCLTPALPFSIAPSLLAV